MSFAAKLALRSADVYADFLMPYVTGASHVLDVGCGSGTISIGLAQRVGRVTGVDLREDDFIAAREYAATHAMRNVEFQVGDIYALDVPTGASTPVSVIRSSRHSIDHSTVSSRSSARFVRAESSPWRASSTAA